MATQSILGQHLNSQELQHFYKLTKKVRATASLEDLNALHEIDERFLATLARFPALLRTRYPDTDSITRQFAVASVLASRSSDPYGISALHFAFRHRLVRSCLHVVDALNLPLDGRYFDDPGHTVVENPGMSLLDAAIGRACLERSEFIRHTVHLHGDTYREACKRFVLPYVDLVDGLLERGAKPPIDAPATLWNTIVDRRINEGADLGLFESLVRHGFDLNASDVAYRLRYNPRPPAHSLDDINAGISKMVSLGLDLNRAHPRFVIATVVDGRRLDTAITPLERALFRGDASSFQCLLDHGASVLTARGFRAHLEQGNTISALKLEAHPDNSHEQDAPRELQHFDAQVPVDFIEAVGSAFSAAMAADIRARRMREQAARLTSSSAIHRPLPSGRGRTRLSL